MAYNALKFKLLLIGDSSVGKTCMMCKFANDTFDTTQKPTIGKDSFIKLDKNDKKCCSKFINSYVIR